jgi:hypothetical protein
VKIIMASSGAQRSIKLNSSPAQQAAAGTAAAEVKNQRQTSLLDIPKAVMRNHVFLSPDMDDKSLAAFARSSLYARKLAQPELDQRAVKKLFEHIRDGEIDKVKKILNANPRLALVEWKAAKCEEKTIANKAGQSISIEKKTAYEFAIGEEDTELAVLFRASIVKAANEERADLLLHKQRPKGWEEEEAKRSAPIFTQLDVLTQAIRNAPLADIISSGDPDYQLIVREGSAVAEQLAEFRSMLDATLKETITTGRHFNATLLQRVFEIYNAHYEDSFGNDWSNPKAMLFWQQSIGYVQRFMPANYVQAFCDGLYNTTRRLQKGTPHGRLSEFEMYRAGNWARSDFYPLFSNRLGFDFAICLTLLGDRVGASLARAVPAGLAAERSALRIFEAYVNQKQQAYRAYSAPRLST